MGGALGTLPITHQEVLDTAIMSVDPQTQRLFDAIAATNYFQVKRALAAGAVLDCPNTMGQTPLAVAHQCGNAEIVNLLIATGASMQVHSSSASVSTIHDSNANIAATTADADGEISYDRLLDLIHQPLEIDSQSLTLNSIPTQNRSIATAAGAKEIRAERSSDLSVTEIEQPLTIDAKSILPSATNPAAISLTQNLNLQAVASDPEATYTFDLDAVFSDADSAPLGNADLLAEGGTIYLEDAIDEGDTIYIDLDRSIDEGDTICIDLDRSIDEGDTIYIDLDRSIDDNGTMFADDDFTIMALGVPIATNEIHSDDATHTFDLDSHLEKLSSDPVQSAVSSMLMGEWQDEATYAVGLDEFDRSLGAIDIDDLNDVAHLLQAEDRPAIFNDCLEEGETYAIDLDDLDLAVGPAVYILTDLDSSLFPAIGGEDGESEPDFDADIQTSTDIFGQSNSKSAIADVGMQTHNEDLATNSSLMAALVDGDTDLAQQAIAPGTNLNRFDWNLGYTPLGIAIDRGYTEVVKCLLDAGANSHYGSTTTTALGLAAESGATEIVQLLLPRGVDVNEPVERDNWTALLSAIKSGRRSVVELLVTAGADVNIWSRGETPILLAAKCEEREIYQYLYPLVNTTIRLCADRDGERLLQSTHKRRIREQNRPIEKFINLAVVGDLDEVKQAIEIGIEIDELGSGGHTALMAAAYYGHKSLVKTLLAAGANPNLLSDDEGLGMGMTALMLTAGSFFAHNRQEIAKLLIDTGADVNQQGTRGKTAIFYAALAGSTGYRDCVDTLIDAGADLNLRDDRGHTVLTSVAATENYQLLNLLIQAGAATAGLESVQLIQAATVGNAERVRSLITDRVNLNLERGAAIGNAAAAGNTEIVELLIRAGANVNLSNCAGFTPIASAAYAGYGEIVRLLIDAGADIQAPTSESYSYSALEYAQMGLYQFECENRQHAQIIRQLAALERL